MVTAATGKSAAQSERAASASFNSAAYSNSHGFNKELSQLYLQT